MPGTYEDATRGTYPQRADLYQNYSPPPGDTWSDSYAQETRAWLARQEWADYQSRFQPVEDELINTVTSTELLDQRLAAIKANSAQASSAAGQAAQMMQQRYGVQPGQAQSQAQQTRSQLSSTAGAIDAANNTRAAIYDRNLSVLGGGGARQTFTPDSGS